MSKKVINFISVLFIFSMIFLGCQKSNAETKTTTAVMSDKADSVKEKDFSVIAFSPEGEIPAVKKFPSIQIQFSEPVVALKALGKEPEKIEYIKIEPPLNGKFRWYGTSLLCFESSDAIIPQKEYTFTVSGDLTSAAGKKITGRKEFKFSTESLKLLNIIPGYTSVNEGSYLDMEEVPVKNAAEIALFFNGPVNPSVIRNNITVATDKGDAFAFNVTALSSSSIILNLDKTPEEDKDIYVTLTAGAHADEDCKKITEDQIFNFHTIKPFAIKEVAYENLYLDKEFINPVQIEFNHALKEGDEAKICTYLSTLPAMKIGAENVSVQGRYLIIHSLPVEYNSIYTLLIDGKIEDAEGKALGESATYDIKVPDAISFVQFKDYGSGILEAAFSPRIAFAFQNVYKDESYYELIPYSTATGKRSEKEEISFDMAEMNIPENTKIIQTVDLEDALDETENGYRGAVKFESEIKYRYNRYNWNLKKDETVKETANNSQFIQVTDIGVTTRYGYNKAAVFVTSLSTGKPIPNAKVDVVVPTLRWEDKRFPEEQILNDDELYPVATGYTGAGGFAVIEMPEDFISELKSYRKGTYFKVTTEDDCVTFRPNHSMYRTGVYNVGNIEDNNSPRMISFVYSDRGLYKPGETVSLSGIDRTLHRGKYTPYEGDYILYLQKERWDSNSLDTVFGKTDKNGTFSGKFVLPENLEPGTYCITYERECSGTRFKEYLSIQVQYFERLRFETKAAIAPLTYYSGDKLDAQISARYLGGGNLGQSAYNYYWSREPCGFTLSDEKYSELRFGPLVGYDGKTTLEKKDGVLSGEGKATVSQQTGGESLKGMAYNYRVEARIRDAGNQMVSTSASTVVHPAKYYIGVSRIKGIKGFPKKDDTLKFDYVCVTPEGDVPSAKELPSDLKNKLKIELQREEWKQVQQVGWNGQLNTRYVREMVTEEEKTVNLSADGYASEISVVPPKGGAYLLRLSSVDANQNEVITETRFYVTSSDWNWYNRNTAQEITMITDKTMYSAGDTANILVQSPLPKGSYLLTVERESLLEERIIELNEPTSVIEIPVKEEYIPVMYVTLSSFTMRSGEPAKDFNTPDINKPKPLFGLAVLNVDSEQRRFDVTISTDKQSYRPGEEAVISLHAEKNGEPVPEAGITLMAVDRGVIDLINYHVPDPLKYFYDVYLFHNCVKGGDSRSSLMDPVTYELKNLVGGDSLEDEDGAKIKERKNFEPTAVFAPSLVTDENGDVQWTVTLPDTLTSYRITTVGVKENDFSLTEKEISVTNPVSVREVLPSKLRVDDISETGVTITNLDETDYEITIHAEIIDGTDRVAKPGEMVKKSGKAELNGETEKSILVKANSTEALMFDFTAKKEGWVTVCFTVESEVINERILKPLEIEETYVFETVTTIGQMNDTNSVTEKIVLPVVKDGDKVDMYVQLDATKLGALRESVNYVLNYPYAGMEQRTSFVFPLVAFGKYMETFGMASEVPNPEQLAVEEIKTWVKEQKNDGSFGYWSSSTQGSLFVSLRAGEILALCNEKNILTYENSGIRINDLSAYIYKNVMEMNALEHKGAYTDYMRAYSVYVLSRLGVSVTAEEIKEIAESPDADISTLAFCGLALYENKETSEAKKIADRINKYITRKTRGIDITSPLGKVSWWSFFNDKAEDLALVLSLFSKIDTKNEINGRAVYELLELEKAGNGYWKSTAVTTRVLTAFDVYITRNKLTETNLTAKALLGEKEILSAKFKGLDTKAAEISMKMSEEPLASVNAGEEQNLTISKEGKNTLYYTVSLKYPVAVEDQIPRENGICVYTEITDVKTGEPVDADKLETDRVYRETVYVSSAVDQQFVALRAPIPAGAEIMNAAFVTTGTYPSVEKSDKGTETLRVDVYSYDGWDAGYTYSWDSGFGLSHQAIYENEVQYFWNFFPKGYQKVDFIIRPVRKGKYQTPGALAQCMYEEETFGRTAGIVWEIE